MSKESPILVVEDDPSDTLLLQRAFSKVPVRTPVHFFRDGQELLDYLDDTAGLTRYACSRSSLHPDLPAPAQG